MYIHTYIHIYIYIINLILQFLTTKFRYNWIQILLIFLFQKEKQIRFLLRLKNKVWLDGQHRRNIFFLFHDCFTSAMIQHIDQYM